MCKFGTSLLLLALLLYEGYAEAVTDGSACIFTNLNKIDCTRRNLTNKPFLFIDMTIDEKQRINEIDFSFNDLQVIGDNWFNGFDEVKVLRLTGNKLNGSSIKRVFRSMPELRDLYLDQNEFRNIPTHIFSDLKQLMRLSIDGNYIKRITDHAFIGLERLKVLRIRRNEISYVSNDAFSGLNSSLQQLNIKGNYLKVIPGAIKTLKRLISVELSDNEITKIEKNSFKGLPRLKYVRLFTYTAHYEDSKKNKKKHMMHIDTGAFRGMTKLRKLNLDSSYAILDKFPNLEGTNNLHEISLRSIYDLTIPNIFCDRKRKLEIIRITNSTIFNFPKLNKCRNLRTIDLESNDISYIPASAFSGLNHITNIDILQNHNSVKTIHKSAFNYLPSLQELDLSHYFLNSFPDFRGTFKLKKLKLQHCDITVLPRNFCRHLPNLETLDLSENKISTLPVLSDCRKLRVVDLLKNRISSIRNQFNNLRKLEMLTLTDNHLNIIPNSAFKGCPSINSLYLDWNMLQSIEENAFMDISNLELLNISYNSHLRNLPKRGLNSLVVIDAVKNPKLLDFPKQEDLKFARQLRLTYPYHCCHFKEHILDIQHTIRMRKLRANSTWVIDTQIDHTQILAKFNATRQKEIDPRSMEPLLRQLNKNSTSLRFYPDSGNYESFFKGRSITENSYCIPETNDFFPCEDLMGREWLRVCVWLVIFLAVFGNIFVLIVLVVNYAKIDVPRFLIINLAFADLCLGIYLAFLAFVDLFTLGDFRLYGLQWQFSPSCKGAGFLAVFSSELSVYTLSAITIERFTTIKNSMHIEKRMTKKQAVIIMAIGWVFSIVLAALPLYTDGKVRFSDYSKYSVCLPFDIETLTSQAYVTFVLMFNLLAFIIILACYIRIYLFISGSHAWNSGDARIARRMAILVFTDFLCWFPIALIALSAVYKESLIADLWISKVLTIFVFPLNACANPFLYAILTKQFRKDIMLFVRHVKGKSIQREIRKSLLKTQFKNSLTYSTSVRRGSSFSFLFGRRCSSKPDEIKLNTRIIPVQEPFPLSSEELEHEDSESHKSVNSHGDEGNLSRDLSCDDIKNHVTTSSNECSVIENIVNKIPEEEEESLPTDDAPINSATSEEEDISSSSHEENRSF